MRTRKFAFEIDWPLVRYLAETASWADSGQLQFWSEPSEINLRSSNIPKTVGFTPL